MAKLTVLPKRLDVLNANDPTCKFRINIDVLNECFGADRSIYMRAAYPDSGDGTIPGTKPGDRFFAWMPKLFSNSSLWKNSISDDTVSKTCSSGRPRTRRIKTNCLDDTISN